MTDFEVAPDLVLVVIAPNDLATKVNSMIESVRRDLTNTGHLMNESLLLRSATVQEIQLELIRRTRFNQLDGEEIYGSLMAHRDLWQAVLLDRVGLPDKKDLRLLFAFGLIKLRDLPGNQWNADSLFVLTKDHDQARQWPRIAEQEAWEADDVHVYEDQQEIDRALGIYTMNNGLVEFWWD